MILDRVSTSNNLRRSFSSRLVNRSENLFQSTRFSTSFDKPKEVDYNPDIPKTHYTSEKYNESKQPSLPTSSDMLPHSERLNHQCNVIYSIDRKNECKTSQIHSFKMFHRTFKKMFAKDEIKSFRQEYYDFSEDLSFYKWAHFKVLAKRLLKNLFKILLLK